MLLYHTLGLQQHKCTIEGSSIALSNSFKSNFIFNLYEYPFRYSVIFPYKYIPYFKGNNPIFSLNI